MRRMRHEYGTFCLSNLFTHPDLLLALDSSPFIDQHPPSSHSANRTGLLYTAASFLPVVDTRRAPP